MTVLDIDEKQLLVSKVEVSDSTLVFIMADGRGIEAPLWW